VADLTDVFPSRRYLQRPPKEALFRGGLVSGVRLASRNVTFDSSLAVGSDEDTTEDLVLDSIPLPPARVPAPFKLPLKAALRIAVPAQAPQRRWTRHALHLEALS
jgi:hypothetical protein